MDTKLVSLMKHLDVIKYIDVAVSTETYFSRCSKNSTRNAGKRQSSQKSRSNRRKAQLRKK